MMIIKYLEKRFTKQLQAKERAKEETNMKKFNKLVSLMLVGAMMLRMCTTAYATDEIAFR